MTGGRDSLCVECGGPCSGKLTCRHGGHPLCVPCSVNSDRFGGCKACDAENRTDSPVEVEIRTKRRGR